jgi:hypothetical protein
MERERAFGLLKKIISTVLIAATLTGAIPPPPAEAFIQEIIAEIVILASLAAINKGILPKIVDAAESAYGAVGKTYMYEALYIDQQRNQRDLEEELYDLDHKALSSSAVVYRNLAPFLTAYAGASPRSDGKTGVDAWSAAGFRAANPGYRNVSPGSAALIFSNIHGNRVKRMTEDYAAGFAASNAGTARDVLTAGSPTGLAAVRDLMNAMYQTAGLENGGYRRIAQAAAQIQTANNQQVSRLRAETTAQTDAYAVFALNEIQERTDKTAAFEQAVRIWTPVSAGAGY